MTAGRDPRFGSVVTAMVTPFDDAGALDVDGAVELARWLVDHGSDGLVLGGSTGEGTVLTDAERRDLCSAVCGAVTVPVVVASGTNDTAHSIELTKSAESLGAAGLLVVTPYYSRPSAAGIERHFRAVASATTLPVILYDIPVRTGRRIPVDLLIALGNEGSNIVAVKDATGDVTGAARVISGTPAGFEHYSGDDVMTLPFLALGSVGLISVASHWDGERIGEMFRAFDAGDLDRARELNAALAASFDFETGDDYPNPMPAKAACRAMGLPAGQCRAPNALATAELDSRAAEIVAAVRGRG